MKILQKWPYVPFSASGSPLPPAHMAAGRKFLKNPGWSKGRESGRKQKTRFRFFAKSFIIKIAARKSQPFYPIKEVAVFSAAYPEMGRKRGYLVGFL